MQFEVVVMNEEIIIELFVIHPSPPQERHRRYRTIAWKIETKSLHCFGLIANI